MIPLLLRKSNWNFFRYTKILINWLLWILIITWNFKCKINPTIIYAYEIRNQIWFINNWKFLSIRAMIIIEYYFQRSVSNMIWQNLIIGRTSTTLSTWNRLFKQQNVIYKINVKMTLGTLKEFENLLHFGWGSLKQLSYETALIEWKRKSNITIN